MRIIMRLFFSLFLIFCGLICEARCEEIQEVNLHLLKLQECLLPKDHFLYDQLEMLFSDSNLDTKMFKSNEHWEAAGFEPVKKSTNPDFMVAKHPSLEKFLFKKYKDDIPLKIQLDNYVNRISAARALQTFIQLNDLQYIVVPQKWLYKLPKRFSKKGSYILIVEKMDVCKGGHKPDSEVGSRYNSIDFDILRELCIVLYYFRGLDSCLRNMPFTYQNKITFIDTEKWLDKDREFLHRAFPYLTPDRQQYALSVWQELHTKNNSKE